MFCVDEFIGVTAELVTQKLLDMFWRQVFNEFILELSLQYAVEMSWTQAFRAQKLLDTFWRQVFNEIILELSVQYAVEMFWTQLFDALSFELSFQ